MHANQLKTERRASKLSGLQGRRQEVEGKGGRGWGKCNLFLSLDNLRQAATWHAETQTDSETNKRDRGKAGGRQRHTRTVEQTSKQTSDNNMKHVTQGGLLICYPHCPPSAPLPPPPPSFTRILHSYISQTFRNIFVLLTQSRFIHFYSLPCTG